jgi:hypothetical protein
MRKFYCLLAAMLLLSLPSFAQTQGQITGVVTDPSAAVVSGATVTVTNPQTNFTRSAATNASGNYTFPALQPGIYNVKVESPGFQAEIRSGVQLQVEQVARIDFQLKVGAVAETVEVTGGAPLLRPAHRSQPQRRGELRQWRRPGQRSPGRRPDHAGDLGSRLAPRVQQLHAGRN